MLQQSILEEASEETGLIEQGEISDLNAVNPQNNSLYLSKANSTPQNAKFHSHWVVIGIKMVAEEEVEDLH